MYCSPAHLAPGPHADGRPVRRVARLPQLQHRNMAQVGHYRLTSVHKHQHISCLCGCSTKQRGHSRVQRRFEVNGSVRRVSMTAWGKNEVQGATLCVLAPWHWTVRHQHPTFGPVPAPVPVR